MASSLKTNNQPQPLFSVVIPTYNRRQTLPRALSSVLHQSYTDFELIVVDDGSTDHTSELIRQFNDPRLHYIEQENRGRCAARNRGVAAAAGTYVTFLDSDDEALPHWLENFASAIRAEKIGLICAGCQRYQANQMAETILPTPIDPFFGPIDAKTLFLAGTFAVDRQIFSAIRGYTESLTFSENTELALRLVPYCIDHYYRIVDVQSAGIIYHLARPTKQPFAARQAQLRSSEYILANYAKRLAAFPRVHSYYLATAGVRAVKVNELRKARRFFREAIQAQPLQWRNYSRWLTAHIPPMARLFWLRHDWQIGLRSS